MQLEKLILYKCKVKREKTRFFNGISCQWLK